MVTYSFTITQNPNICNEFTIVNGNTYSVIEDVTYQAIIYTDIFTGESITIDLTEFENNSPDPLTINIPDGQYSIIWRTVEDNGGDPITTDSEATVVFYDCVSKCCALEAISNINIDECNLENDALIVYAYYRGLEKAVTDGDTALFYDHLHVISRLCNKLKCNCK